MKTRSSQVRWVIFVSFAVLLIFAIYWGWTWRERAWAAAAADFPEQYRLAKAEGLPLELVDLHLPRSIDAKDNRAAIYREIFDERAPSQEKRHSVRAADYSYTASLDQPPSVIDRKVAERIVSRLQLASKRPLMSFQRDWSQGFDIAFPELARGKDIVKLVAAHAQIEANEGHVEEACRCIELAKMISSDLGSEPTLIGGLVQVATDAIIGRAVEAIASKWASNSQGLAKLEKTLRYLSGHPSIRQSISGEIVIGRIGLRQVKSLHGFASAFTMESEENSLSNWLEFLPLGPDSNNPLRNLGRPAPELIAPALDARYLEYWRTAYPEMLKIRTVIPEARASEAMAERWAHSPDPSCRAIGILVPVFAQASNAFLNARAHRDLVLLKIKLLRHKLAKGIFPKTLAELGEAPTDACSGKPLIYRPNPTGFLLYSVGIDGKDDGGKFKSQVGNPGRDTVVEHPLSPEKLPSKPLTSPAAPATPTPPGSQR